MILMLKSIDEIKDLYSKSLMKYIWQSIKQWSYITKYEPEVQALSIVSEY